MINRVLILILMEDIIRETYDQDLDFTLDLS